jgi:hypothetical protein
MRPEAIGKVTGVSQTEGARVNVVNRKSECLVGRCANDELEVAVKMWSGTVPLRL